MSARIGQWSELGRASYEAADPCFLTTHLNVNRCTHCGITWKTGKPQPACRKDERAQEASTLMAAQELARTNRSAGRARTRHRGSKTSFEKFISTLLLVGGLAWFAIRMMT